MFCVSCGQQLADDSWFCGSCGAASAALSQVVVERSLQAEPTVNRDVVLLHLRNLRFLEIARERLRKNIATADGKIANAGMRQPFSYPTRKSVNDGWLATAICGIAVGGVVLGVGAGFGEVWGVVSSFGLGVCVVGVGAAVMWIEEAVAGNRRYRQRVSAALADYNNKVQYELYEKDQLSMIRPQMLAEWQKVDQLLAKAYSADIVGDYGVSVTVFCFHR